MVVVMSPEATDAQVAHVVARVEAVGGQAFVSTGVQRTIIGLVGDIEAFHHLNLRSLPGVADVHRISDPFKLVSRQHHPERSTVWVGRAGHEVPIGPDTFTLLAGPCVIESAEQALAAARMAASAGATILRGGVFTSSPSPYAAPGLGTAGLTVLADVGRATGLPVVTEVVDVRDVDTVAAHVDLIQVGARDMGHLSLLDAVGRCGRPVMLTRGLTATVEEWLMAAEYVAQRGNLDIVLCERGIRTFEPATHTTLDISAVPLVQAASHLPVIVDPSHVAGRQEFVVPLARAAIAVGADGVLVDVHPDPETARCEGPQPLSSDSLRALASTCRRLPTALGREHAAARIRTR